MNREWRAGAFERALAVDEAAVSRHLSQQRREQLALALAGVDVVGPDELPEDLETYLATVDAHVEGVGLVRAGQFFDVPAHLVEKFQASRTFLAASRPALRRLEALRDQLAASGEAGKGVLVDLRPVRPRGERPAEEPKPKRTADGGES